MRSGVLVTWGNVSTLILWVQWDLIVAMMDRSGSIDQKMVLSSATVRDLVPQTQKTDEQAKSIRDSNSPAVRAFLERSGAEDEAGYSTEETTHSG